MTRYLSARDIDWTVLIIVLLICSVGVLQIYSATRDTDFQSAWWKQIVYILGGMFFLWVLLAFDYHSLLRSVRAMYIASVLALLATYLVGDKVYGSRRWIPLGAGIH